LISKNNLNMAAPLTDRFDSHSISQESSSEHPNHSLEDLTDEQIQLQIEDITYFTLIQFLLSSFLYL
jgi:hypothetical protein